MSITARHTFGWAQEKLLQPVIEKILGRSMTKTTQRFAKFDWDTEGLNVELKSRTCSSGAYDTWLLPACKAEKADKTDKQTVFFYYFDGDKSLWMLYYSKALFDTFEKSVPYPSTQLHLLVPASCWTRITTE